MPRRSDALPAYLTAFGPSFLKLAHLHADRRTSWRLLRHYTKNWDRWENLRPAEGTNVIDRFRS